MPADRVAAQAYSSFDNATVVDRRRASTEVAEPIEIVVNGPGEDTVAYGHLQIRVERLSPRRSWWSTCAAAEPTPTTSRSSSVIRPRLGLIWIADWADDMVHVSAHHATLGKDAVLGHVNVTLGGDVVRTSATVRFTGPGGDAKLLGTYFADDGQHFESRLLVDHAQPNCKSDVLYKGALQGGSGLRQARCPHGVDRRRADPRRGRRHRHLRGEPQPGAHRRRPRRLGAQPRRSRPARSWAPGTPVPPGVSTTSSCSTCARRGIPGGAGPAPGRARLLQRDHRPRSPCPRCVSA